MYEISRPLRQFRLTKDIRNALKVISFLVLLSASWVVLLAMSEVTGFTLGLANRLALTSVPALGVVGYRAFGKYTVPHRRLLLGLVGTIAVVSFAMVSYLSWSEDISPPVQTEPQERAVTEITWTQEAEERIQGVPFFMRGVVRRATEGYARSQGYQKITADVVTEVRQTIGR
jgi:hypothetical protein